MILCGQEVLKGDIVQLKLNNVYRYIPVLNPVCIVESTKKWRKEVAVFYNGTLIHLTMDMILRVTVLQRQGEKSIVLFGERYYRGDKIKIKDTIYTFSGIDRGNTIDSTIYVVVENRGLTFKIPINELLSYKISKIQKDEYYNPLSYGSVGRGPIISKGKVVGINFGAKSGDYATLEDGLAFIKRINDNKPVCKLKNKNSNLELAMLSKYIISPYKFKKFSVNIQDATLGLKPGEYTCFGFSNRSCEKYLTQLISKSDNAKILIPTSEEYLLREDFGACYDWGIGWFYIMLKTGDMDGAIKCIELAMSSKRLAVFPKPMGKTGLGIVFLDKYFSLEELKNLKTYR